MMNFGHCDEFTRLRAAYNVDPYSQVKERTDWSNPEVLTIDGAYINSLSSTDQTDPLRAKIITTKQLVVDDPDVDIRVGDRVTDGVSTWTVTGIPAVDKNPFTGWRPTLVANLEEVRG